ncbi:hypothetical protein CRG98_043395 [Punica granatum]|nr:hypothetical protein CRG98_043395 [Punica granatum]
MNELRPCAPISLKHILAQELIKGLRAVSDLLLRYNSNHMLRESESGLFLSLCRAFIEVAYPHCATCFGRCYPGGAAIIMDAKGLCQGVSRLLMVSPAREIPRPLNHAEERTVPENGETPVLENGDSPGVPDEPLVTNSDGNEKPTPGTDENQQDV